jgi:beta-aspartyl-peptidase (threonine type)
MPAFRPGPTLLIHGGVGPYEKEFEEPRRAGLARAAEAARAVLAANGTALDAVVRAVTVLEDDPVFNAGRGSVLNAAGEVETDAAVMDGASGNAGAVAGVQGIVHPVLLARAVLNDGRAVLLVGRGAERFAEERGLERCDPKSLIVETQRAALNRHHRGTVGAVALDSTGRLAAATSTGGLTGKLAGRVGDTPLIGCGTYADRRVAVSATGDGESVVRLVLAHRLALRYAEGRDLAAAVRDAADLFRETQPGILGLIAVSAAGEIVARSLPGTHLLVARWNAGEPEVTSAPND